MKDLQAKIENFTDSWGPEGGGPLYHLFLIELRDLLETYGAATLQHQSFPDTEHQHGDPL